VDREVARRTIERATNSADGYLRDAARSGCALCGISTLRTASAGAARHRNVARSWLALAARL